MKQALADGSKVECKPTGEEVVIQGYKITVQSTRYPSEVYLIGAVDPTQDPPSIDLYPAETPKGKGGPIKGVYRFNDDWLIITLGEPRPKEVSAMYHQGLSAVYVLKRK